MGRLNLHFIGLTSWGSDAPLVPLSRFSGRIRCHNSQEVGAVDATDLNGIIKTFWCVRLSGIIPEFLGKVDETQYGVDGRMSQIVLRLRAYPTPKVTWYYHNTKSVLKLYLTCS